MMDTDNPLVGRNIDLSNEKTRLEAELRREKQAHAELIDRYNKLNEMHWQLQDRYLKVQETLLKKLY